MKASALSWLIGVTPTFKKQRYSEDDAITGPYHVCFTSRSYLRKLYIVMIVG